MQVIGGGFTVQVELGIDAVHMAHHQVHGHLNVTGLDGVDHLIVQNVFRTDVNQYSALRLE